MSGQAVSITDIVKNSISATDIIVYLIIGTSLIKYNQPEADMHIYHWFGNCILHYNIFVIIQSEDKTENVKSHDSFVWVCWSVAHRLYHTNKMLLS